MSQASEISVLPGHSAHTEKFEKGEFSLDEFEWESWPILDTKALFGFAGEFVELATEKSEADPAAVLVTFLTRFGVECGPHHFLMVGDTKHYARIFSVIVGATSKARKGTSGRSVDRLFDLSSKISHHAALSKIQYETARTTPGPLSSGEGIISMVRDPKEEWNPREEKLMVTDPGIQDKRLFVLDEEFGSALSCTKREGNTLSTILRSTWDTGTLEPITKTNKISTTNSHIGICTHITLAELHEKMNHTDAFSGFANRFLWCCARRSKIVSFPEPMPADELSDLQEELLEIINKAGEPEEMKFNGYARKKWDDIYRDLSRDRGGLLGSVTNRAEAQVLRLSMIYALLDRQKFIGPEHLEAAFALWGYCEASARYVFSGRESNPYARKILHALKEGSKSTTDLHAVFKRKLKADELKKAIDELIVQGKIEAVEQKSGGKPRQVFRLVAE